MSDDGFRDATLVVTLDDGRGLRLSGAKRISGPFYDAYDPVDVCTNPEVAVILRLGFRDNVHTEESVRVVQRRRGHYADILAKEIAACIVEQMESRDTRDGYAQEREG